MGLKRCLGSSNGSERLTTRLYIHEEGNPMMKKCPTLYARARILNQNAIRGEKGLPSRLVEQLGSRVKLCYKFELTYPDDWWKC
jgi:hypothetical protein